MPIGLRIFVVSEFLPCRHLFPNNFDIVDSSVQALARKHMQFYLGHIQPASMLRGIHKLKPVPQRLCLIWRKHFIKLSRVVRVQVIHHQRYLFCTFVLTGDLFYKTSTVHLGFSFCDFDHAFSCQWLTGKENVAYAATPVFIVVFSHRPW